MKKTATKSLRSGLSLLLALCLMLSLCGAAFADSESAPTVETVLPDSVKTAFDDVLDIINDFGLNDEDLANDANDYASNLDSESIQLIKDSLKDLLKIAEDELAVYADDISAEMGGKAENLEDALRTLKTELEDTNSVLYNDLVDQLKDLRSKLAEIDADEAKDDVKAARDEVTAEINKVLALMAETKDKADKLTNEINAINNKLAVVNDLLAGLNGDVKDLVGTIKDMAADVDNVSDSEYADLAKTAENYAKAALYVIDLYDNINNTASEASDLLRNISDEVKSTVSEVKALYNKYTDSIGAINEVLSPLVDAVIKDLRELAGSDAVKNAESGAAKVDALQKEYGDYIRNVLDSAEKAAKDAEQAYRDEQAAIREEINSLYAQLEAVGDVPQSLIDKHDELEARQSELKARLSALRDELADAGADARAEIEDDIQKVQDEIDKVEASLVALNSEIQDFINNSNRLVDEIRAKIDEAEARYQEIEGKVDEVVAKYIGESNAKVDALNAELEAKIKEAWNFSDDAFEHAASDGRQAAAYYAQQLQKAVDMLDNLSKTTLDDYADLIDETMNTLANYADHIKTDAQSIKDKLIQTVKECKQIVKKRYPIVDEGLYELADDNYYVSFGDDSALGDFYKTVAKLIDEDAEHPGYDIQNNSENMALTGMRIDDLLALVSGQDVATLGAFSDDYVEAVNKADLITLSFNPLTYASELAGANTDFNKLDWAQYVGSKGADYVTVAIKTLEAELKDHVPSQASKLTNVAAAYAYSYAALLTKYAETVDKIHEINPDAVVVIVGTANSFEGVEYTYGSHSIPIGKLFEEITDLMDAYFIAYTLNRVDDSVDASSFDVTGDDLAKIKTVFVRVRGAETELASTGVDSANLKGATASELASAINPLITKDAVTLTEAGNAYVGKAIYEALHLTPADNTPVESEEPTDNPPTDKPTESTEPVPTVQPTKNPTDSPKTGDEQNIAVWAIVLVVCGVATVAILPRKKVNK